VHSRQGVRLALLRLAKLDRGELLGEPRLDLLGARFGGLQLQHSTQVEPVQRRHVLAIDGHRPDRQHRRLEAASPMLGLDHAV